MKHEADSGDNLAPNTPDELALSVSMYWSFLMAWVGSVVRDHVVHAERIARGACFDRLLRKPDDRTVSHRLCATNTVNPENDVDSGDHVRGIARQSEINVL